VLATDHEAHDREEEHTTKLDTAEIDKVFAVVSKMLVEDCLLPGKKLLNRLYDEILSSNSFISASLVLVFLQL
jgi:hypothetical protein